MSQLKRGLPFFFPTLFDDSTVRRHLTVLGGLITVIVVNYRYVPYISNTVGGAVEICIDYLTNAKWTTVESANKFRWVIAKKESIVLPEPTQTRSLTSFLCVVKSPLLVEL